MYTYTLLLQRVFRPIPKHTVSLSLPFFSSVFFQDSISHNIGCTLYTSFSSNNSKSELYLSKPKQKNSKIRRNLKPKSPKENSIDSINTSTSIKKESTAIDDFRYRRLVPSLLATTQHRHPPKSFKKKRKKLSDHTSLPLGNLFKFDISSEKNDLSVRAQIMEDLITDPNPVNLYSIFGERAADTLRYLHNTKNYPGDSLETKNPESILKGMDYLTSPLGSTEDLVGERRAMMDHFETISMDDKRKYVMDLKNVFAEAEEKQWDLDHQEEDDDDANLVDEETRKMKRQEEKKAVDQFNKGENKKILENSNQMVYGPWATLIVRTDRVQKVLQGGTMQRFRSLVIGGNTNGCAGFGIGKAYSPSDATESAIRMSKRNIFFVDRYQNSGISSDLVGKHNSCRVFLRGVKSNYGLRGHPLILEILKMFGISNCGAKSHGNRNVYNVVYATFKALCTHESINDVALKRGKRLINLQKAKKLGLVEF